MKAERVFVSGAAGVIGRELVPKLLSRGAIVWAADLKARPAEIPLHVQYRQGDLNFLSAAEVSDFRPTVFIHLAATFERSEESYGFWNENFEHNVRLSHHLMSLLKASPDLRRVVFASSYLIYDPQAYQFATPQAEATPLCESTPVRPRNLTGSAKLAHELELNFLAAHCGEQFSCVSARIFRGYGKGSRDIISRWVRGALAGDPLPVFRPEGLFDYIYAADSAEGLIRLAENKGVTGVINLGSGNATRVGDVLAAVLAQTGAVPAKEESSDIPYEASVADISRLKEAIGWSPPTEIAEGVRQIVSFERLASAPARRPLGNVLVSSAAAKIPLLRAVMAAAKSLSPEARVLAGDIDPAVPARYVADGFLTLPALCDDVLPTIIDLLRREGIQVVIPTRDGELLFWARHSRALKEQGVEVVVSQPRAIEIARDKLAFSRHVSDVGLPAVPCVAEPESETAWVVKERYGAGSRCIGLKLSATEAAAHAETLEAPVFQPFFPGPEISIDAWLDRHHRVKGIVIRSRDRVINGESVVTTTFRDAAIEAQCRLLLESLPLRGPVVVQMLRDGADVWRFLELNPRFGGASTTAVQAGLEVWRWSLGEAIGCSADEFPFHRLPGEVRQVRVPSDVYVHDPRV